MEVCNFLCFGSAIRSLCQKLFLLEKYVHIELCTPNESKLRYFLVSGYIYIHINIIALTSEYHLDSKNSLFTEINRCRVGQKRHISAVICRLCQKPFFFGKNVHIELCIKTAFLFSLWPHMHLNMINLASVYHFHSRN